MRWPPLIPGPVLSMTDEVWSPVETVEEKKWGMGG